RVAARGYHRSVVLGGPPGLRTVRDRETGFAEGFTTGGGGIIDTIPTELTRESGAYALSAHAMRALPAGTLIFGVTDVVAIGALSAIRAAGRAVGVDLALAGFGDIPICRDVTPSLTTVGMPLERIGYLALRAAIDDEWDPTANPVPLEVLVRDSTPARETSP
ncbi:MAG TPA: LacI family DNA-binding transcriptional regulator, partial [Vicinamibacterales bacterium]|nr:LacI family DNA-binding transcriptional regulator [Vicinamibacterales bacterium]